MLERPEAGVHYPGSLADLRAWFPDDAACLDYLDWLRWPGGFVCPHCASGVAWPLQDGRYSCGGRKRRVSVTAGTIFHGTRTPLTVWFEAAWLMMTSKAGTSALNLQRVLGLGSYQTAWAMLHRYRDVMVVPGREKLSGDIEMDETFVGGVKPGKRGRGADGKVLVAGAIERAPKGRRGFGRARLAIIPDAKSQALREFIAASIAPGSVVISDALGSYPSALAGSEYEHNPINVKRSGLKAHQVLPGVHRLFSLAKRWLEGTHRAASTQTICSPTWTTSSSASAGAPRASGACCSSGCWSGPSRPTQSATPISSPTRRRPAGRARSRAAGSGLGRSRSPR